MECRGVGASVVGALAYLDHCLMDRKGTMRLLMLAPLCLAFPWGVLADAAELHIEADERHQLWRRDPYCQIFLDNCTTFPALRDLLWARWQSCEQTTIRADITDIDAGTTHVFSIAGSDNKEHRCILSVVSTEWHALSDARDSTLGTYHQLSKRPYRKKHIRRAVQDGLDREIAAELYVLRAGGKVLL